MAVKFPRAEFAANGWSKVALDWAESLSGSTTTTVDATDLTALEAAIAALTAQAVIDRAAIVLAQQTADDAPLLTPTYNLNPAEVLAITDTHILSEAGDALSDEAGDFLLIEA